MNVNFATIAQEEFDNAIACYENQRTGRGERFRSAVWDTIHFVSAQPRIGNPVPGGCRRRLVLGFPYAIIYRIKNSAMTVVAVVHLARRPDYWLSRLDPD